MGEELLIMNYPKKWLFLNFEIFINKNIKLWNLIPY
jgi:hypothetical protein